MRVVFGRDPSNGYKSVGMKRAARQAEDAQAARGQGGRQVEDCANEPIKPGKRGLRRPQQDYGRRGLPAPVAPPRWRLAHPHSAAGRLSSQNAAHALCAAHTRDARRSARIPFQRRKGMRHAWRHASRAKGGARTARAHFVVPPDRGPGARPGGRCQCTRSRVDGARDALHAKMKALLPAVHSRGTAARKAKKRASYVNQSRDRQRGL